MRIAKVFEGTTPTVGLVHGSGVYRASSLERILGTPLPEGLSPNFDERVFALGLLGLDVLANELATGMHVEDTRIPAPTLLPPVGRDPALIDLAASGPSRALRVSGRALYGDGSAVPVEGSARGAGVGLALALVMGDDLRRGSLDTGLRSVAGACLALTFWLGNPLDEVPEKSWARAPGPSRELGTALGPWLVTRDEWPTSLELSAELRTSRETTRIPPVAVDLDAGRIARELAAVSRFADIHAGDVFLLGGPPIWAPGGGRAALSATNAHETPASGFGTLTIALGGPPSIPGDGLARIDQ